MATTRRRKSLAVSEQLIAEGYRFEFFQAVRLLEQIVATDNESPAVSGIPGCEPIKFKSRPQLSFQAADVDLIRPLQQPDGGKRWEATVTFMGLTGSQGVMPYYLSELVLQELRHRNSTLYDFLGLFNHRSVSFYYRAWRKYQLPVNYEQARRQPHGESDAFTHALLSLAGLGTNALCHRLPVADDALAGFAGQLARPVCTADGLQGMIKQYFGLHTHIRQFQGQWQSLPDDVQTRLPGPDVPRGLNNRLGSHALLGNRSFQIQNKFTLVVEALTYHQFMAIAPGSRKLETLKSFIRFNVGNELDFDLEVTLSNLEVPPLQLCAADDYQPLLGWNTQMSDPHAEGYRTVIRISQDIYAPDDSLPLASRPA